MNGTSETAVETNNVIKVKFNSLLESEDHSIAHPASKNYAVALEDDPLSELLNEFEFTSAEDSVAESDYIHHLENVKDEPLSVNLSALEMSGKVKSQIARLREDFKRMKYYLEELNLDD